MADVLDFPAPRAIDEAALTAARHMDLQASVTLLIRAHTTFLHTHAEPDAHLARIWACDAMEALRAINLLLAPREAPEPPKGVA